MNAQEIFDKVVTHLRKQNSRAENFSTCAYRTEDGKKCAVGCLIPDEFYNEWMEGKTLKRLIDNTLFPQELNWVKEHYYLLDDLQNIHDTSPLRKWEDNFAVLASRYDLTLLPKEDQS